MEWWQIALIVIGSACIVSLIGIWLVWRKASGRTKALAERIGRLPMRAKLQLALGIMSDPQVPLRARILPPLLILYLSLPIDIVPDFIPVIGQLDDIVVVVVGLGLLLRTLPVRVLEERIAALERQSDISSRKTIDA